MSSVLFSPYQLSHIELRNRFMRSATHEFMAGSDGSVTPELVTLYRQLAQGEVGLIVSGFAYVQPSGITTRNQLAVYDDTFIPGLQELSHAVHRHGGKLVLQLVHGGRQSSPKLLGQTPWAPSAVPDTSVGLTPRPMTAHEIEFTIDCFAEACRRAREAGFDAAQLHGAHGYLLNQFLSPYTNRREDEWGGDTERRIRIVLAIIRRARQLAGNDFPLFIKLNSEDFLPGGLEPPEAAEIAQLLDAHGIDMIEVSGGMRESGAQASRPDILSEQEEAYFAPAARLIKSKVRCPVAIVGGLRSLRVMERMIAQGYADLLSLSRPFIREPDLVRTLRLGEKERADCISCNRCFYPAGIRCIHLARARRKKTAGSD